MRWVLESVFCGVQMLLFFTASERRGVLGKSLQVKVIQLVVAVFAVLVIRGFGLGSDAWGGLRCRSVRPFPEMPAGRVCIQGCFISTEHLNLGYCC